MNWEKINLSKTKTLWIWISHLELQWVATMKALALDSGLKSEVKEGGKEQSNDICPAWSYNMKN